MSIGNASVNSDDYIPYLREVEGDCLLQDLDAVLKVETAVSRWEHGLDAKVGIEGAVPEQQMVKLCAGGEYAVAHQEGRPQELVFDKELHIKLQVILLGYKPVLHDNCLGDRLHKEKGALGVDMLRPVEVDAEHHKSYEGKQDCNLEHSFHFFPECSKV